jgi:hypothetical protein
MRYRSPVEMSFGIFRRHHCRECGLIFLSAQRVVTGADAEALLDLMEKQSSGSSKTPGAEDGSVMTGPASGPTAGSTAS